MWATYTRISLIKRIIIGIVIGFVLGLTLPSWTWIGVIGNLFINA